MPKEEKQLSEGPKPFTASLAMIEGGQFQHDAALELRDLCAALSEHHAQHGKAKGTMTITLNLHMESGVLQVDADVKVKAPKLKREKTVFWLDESNNLSQQNPKQLSMELRRVPAPDGERQQPRTVPEPAVK